jgi:hypothetical protein
VRKTRLLVLLLVALASPAAFAAQPPTIDFEDDAAVVSGLAPRGQVAWMSVSREPREGYVRVMRREGIAKDDDGDGAVRLALEPDERIAPRSLWAVVDLASGELALASPAGEAAVREVVFPGRGVARGASNKLDRFEAGREMVELLYARPGAAPAAWGLTAGDGGEADDDGADDGALAAALAGARSLGGSPAPPEELTAGDVVVAVDPRTLDVFAVRLVGAQ